MTRGEHTAAVLRLMCATLLSLTAICSCQRHAAATRPVGALPVPPPAASSAAAPVSEVGSFPEHFRRGIELESEGRLQDAAAQYQRALTINPDNAEAHHHLALVWKEQHNLVAAEAEYRKSRVLRYRENPIAQGALVESTRRAMGDFEYVKIELPLASYEGIDGLPLLVSSYSAENWLARATPNRQFSSVVVDSVVYDAFELLLRMHASSVISADVSGASPDTAPLASDASILFWFPKDRTVDVGVSHYAFTQATQRYLRIDRVTNYEKTRSVLILQEPHWDARQQYSLYRGLQVFFRDNPSLAKSTVFLAEGYPAERALSVRPLTQVSRNPSDDLVQQVLGSYLIPGYVAYTWKYQTTIPILGIEDDGLYQMCGRLWLQTQPGSTGWEAQSVWNYAVVARNRTIAETLAKQATVRENPVLFVGGLHLDCQKANDFRILRNGGFGRSLSQQESALLGTYENLGLHDYLKQARVGYTFIVALSDPIEDSEQSQKGEERYRTLFRAQLGGNYSEYIRSLTAKSAGAKQVTVAPAVQQAAEFAKQTQGQKNQPHAKKSGDNDNEPPDNEPPKKPKQEGADESGQGGASEADGTKGGRRGWFADFLDKLREKLANLKKTLNNTDHHDAARRERKGEVVKRKPDGTPYDHLQEVRNAWNGLKELVQRIRSKLDSDGRLTAEERQNLTSALAEASRLLDAVERQHQ